VDGTKFSSIPSPEETLSTVVHNEMVAESKRQGLKPGEDERRIHDAYTTRRWLNGNTVEVDAESTRTVTYKVKGEEELADISAAFHCTMKFDAKTQKWKVIKSVKYKSE
jgi:flagellar basal body rod protein FlgB